MYSWPLNGYPWPLRVKLQCIPFYPSFNPYYNLPRPFNYIYLFIDDFNMHFSVYIWQKAALTCY